MKIQKLHESTENEARAYATLLTAEEVEKLPERLREYSLWYWLRSPGDDSDIAACVWGDGSVDFVSNNVDVDYGAVRPALKIQNLNQPIGTKFRFGDQIFEVINDETAFCLGDIRFSYFNKTRSQGNDYETSDIKKYEEEDLDTVYFNWSEHFSGYPGNALLTEFFLKCGVNPLDYLESIPVGCYSGIKMKELTIPSNIWRIESAAFFNTDLQDLYIPESVIEISKGAFVGCLRVRIHCQKNSYAQKYADRENLEYVLE